MPRGLGHRAPLLALGADLVRTFVSAGERYVPPPLLWPADHACTSEMRDRCVDAHAHAAPDGEPVDEDDAASLMKSEDARRLSGWQLERPCGFEAPFGRPRPIWRGRRGRLHRKQTRCPGDRGAPETNSRQDHYQ